MLLLTGSMRAAAQSVPDTRLEFLSHLEGRIEIWVWDGTASIKLAENTDYDLSWSRDGRLAFVVDDEIYVWDGVTLSNVSQPPGSDEEVVWWIPYRDTD